MQINNIISAIVVGLIIGALGRLVVPGRQNMGCLSTMLVGIVAALLGTFVADRLDVRTTGSGFGWIELAIQVGIAALAVATLAGGSRRGH
jgi:uncharacterized membrane protein YeaQ/YmgE (transglycosylase-associated protein family)